MIKYMFYVLAYLFKINLDPAHTCVCLNDIDDGDGSGEEKQLGRSEYVAKTKWTRDTENLGIRTFWKAYRVRRTRLYMEE